MEEIYSFGYWVMRRRKALNLTQGGLAQRVSCSPATIKKIERDERRPSLQVAELLAVALAVAGAERDLFLQVARGESPPDHLSLIDRPLSPNAPPHNLPPQPTAFVGRKEDLAAIGAYLAEPGTRMLTVLGPGGMGKTRLALAAAEAKLHDPAHPFPNGVYFVSLAPLEAPDQLIPAIAAAVDFHVHPGGERWEQLLDHLRHKRLLVVLDNFEHLLAGAGLVDDLLAASPGLKVLITSRERLNRLAEQPFAIGGLPFPKPDTTPEGLDGSDWMSYEAVRLFAQSARRARPDFTLTPQNGRHVVELCRLVGGAPLGIVLAASWSGVLSVEEIAGEMRRDLDFAAVEMADVPERQRSLRAAFNHSWRLLDDSERAIFSRLSVFRGGFTREAAAAVAGATLHDLLALANKSLLTRASRGRFDLHDLLRHFAETRLKEPDQVEATHLAHARYYLDLAKDAETRYTGAEQALALNSLEAERHNLNVALLWALDRGNWESAAEMAASLAEFWIIRGYLADGRSWYDKVLAHREKISPTTLATVLFAAGRLAFEGEDYPAAKTLFADSLALWRETDQHRRIAALLIELGRAVEKEGDYGSAIAFYEESLTRFRKLDDRSGAAKVLHRLGFVAQLMGDYDTATTRTEDALALRRELDERRGMASSLNALAEIARTQGDYERARRLYEESLSLCRELGDKRCVAGVSHNMGHIATYQGHYRFAAASFERGFRLYQELDSRLGIVLCLAGMAGVWTARGRAERAARLLGATAKQIDDRHVLLDPADKLAWQQNLERTQAQLDHETFQEAWSIGRTLSLDEALREAMFDGDWRLPGRTAPPRPG